MYLLIVCILYSDCICFNYYATAIIHYSFFMYKTLSFKAFNESFQFTQNFHFKFRLLLIFLFTFFVYSLAKKLLEKVLLENGKQA